MAEPPPVPPPPYRRLPGRSMLPFFSAGCWLADDHLLYVEVAGFVERYRRFHFRDIEAVVVQPTTQANVWSLVWSLLTLFGLIGTVMSGSIAGRVVGGIVLAIGLVPLAIHLTRGPMCATVVQTRINRQPLRSLVRRRDADAALAELLPRIAEAQGAFSDEALAAARQAGLPSADPAAPVAALVDGAEPAPAAPPPPPPGPPPRLLRPEGGLYHRLLCIALWIETFGTGFAIGWRSIPLTLALLLLGLVVFGFSITVLTRQASRLVPPPVRMWTWALFVYLLVRGTVAYGWGLSRYFGDLVGRGQAAGSEWAVQLMDVWIVDSLFLAWFYGALCILNFMFGLSGSVLLRRWGAIMQSPRPPPLPPAPPAPAVAEPPAVGEPPAVEVPSPDEPAAAPTTAAPEDPVA